MKVVSAFFIVVALIALVSPMPVTASSILVQISPSTATVTQGNRVQLKLSLTNPTYAGDKYVLGLSGLPSYANFSFSENPILVSAQGATEVLVISAINLCPGNYSLVVTVEHELDRADTARSQPFRLQVKPGPPLSVRITTDRIAYRAGDHVILEMDSNKPIQAHLTLAPPEGQPAAFFQGTIWSGSNFAYWNDTRATGRWALSLTGGLCTEFSSDVTYFDVSYTLFTVTITATGLTSDLQAPLLVDGRDGGTLSVSTPRTLTLGVDRAKREGYTYQITAASLELEQTRPRCHQSDWEVSYLTTPSTHNFQYDTEYLFKVITDPCECY